MEMMKNKTQAHEPPFLEKRMRELLSRMTLDEKVALLAGKDGGETKAIPRLGIPALRVIDGPAGIGWGHKAVCFPCGAALGATWNPSLIEEVGKALGRETRAAGRHVLLAPCVNIQRAPQAGRNFESFSEDPYHAGVMAMAYVRGVQSEGVGTSLKHFACNNQEWERGSINVEVDERALREIYLPHFERVVREAAPWTVMAAYNKVQGTYCSANYHLLTEVLKNEWGFQGVVVSDWGAAHDTVGCAIGGLDLEMPGPGQFFGPALADAVKRGDVSEDFINDKVLRMLHLLAREGLFDNSAKPFPAVAPNAPEQRIAAERAAEEALVLLKNEGEFLPLNERNIRRLAVVGPNANVFRTGGGSAWVNPASYVTPLQGLIDFVQGRFEVQYSEGCAISQPLFPIPSDLLRPPDGVDAAQGLLGEYFANPDWVGKPVLTRIDNVIDFNCGNVALDPSLISNGFSVRWTGRHIPTESGAVEIGITGKGVFRVYLDGELLFDSRVELHTVTRRKKVFLKAGQSYALKIEYSSKGGNASAMLGWFRADRAAMDASINLARQADAVIFIGGLSDEFDTEGSDRPSLDLPGWQDELIQEIAAVNPRLVVVMIAGSPVNIESWINQVPAVLWAWYPGQEGGRPIARALFGDLNPSGKLPCTFPKRLEDNPSYGNYPGADGVVRYAEGIYVGYRHYDTWGIEPRFPFGHGLSYTTFNYSNLSVSSIGSGSDISVKVQLQIQNTGSRSGAEVVQLYVRDVLSRLPRPAKELKAFQKVRLEPQETCSIEFLLKADAFSYWDPELRTWAFEPGEFELLLGSSSRDIRLRTTILLK